MSQTLEQNISSPTPARGPEEGVSTLRSEGLVKIYGKRTVANDVSFQVSQGEIVG